MAEWVFTIGCSAWPALVENTKRGRERSKRGLPDPVMVSPEHLVVFSHLYCRIHTAMIHYLLARFVA